MIKDMSKKASAKAKPPKTNNDKREKLKKQNKLQFTWLQSAIKARRQELGLTLVEAGAKIGIGKVRMWQIESAEGEMTWSLVMRILRAYEVSPSVFFREIPDFVGSFD